MNIGEIFENAPDLEVKTIMTDSRTRCEAGIFFCVIGMVYDGHDFIDEAVKNGAICIVHSRELNEYIKGITYIMVSDTISALNDFADVFYGKPTKNMTVFGIAGSDGKSTVAMILQQLSNHFTPTAYIGSKGIIKDNVKVEIPRKSINAVYLQMMCHDLRNDGINAVAMEIDNRFVEARYTDNIRFDYLSYTNFNKSKSDQFESDDRYFSSKIKLFSSINENRKAIINIDDEWGKRLAQETTGSVVTYGFDSRADYRATAVRLEPDHTEFLLLHDGKRYEIYSSLLAKFNIYNLVNALALLSEAGYPLEKLIPLCRRLTQMDGRMENITAGQPFNIIVDSVHTLDSFEKVLEYAEKINRSSHRIIIVFGMPGGRDTNKRKEYGKLLDGRCDLVILTVQDPKMESPEDIASQIKSGISNSNAIYIDDRYTAIRQAIELANPKDTVLILGKGNENFQDIKGEKEFWQGDGAVAREIVKELYGGE